MVCSIMTYSIAEESDRKIVRFIFTVKLDSFNCGFYWIYEEVVIACIIPRISLCLVYSEKINFQNIRTSRNIFSKIMYNF